MSALEVIGEITVGALAALAAYVIWTMVAELVRAIRQTCRIARVINGKRWPTLALKKPRRFLYLIWAEYFSSYTSLLIGTHELPRDPSKPIKRRYPA